MTVGTRKEYHYINGVICQVHVRLQQWQHMTNIIMCNKTSSSTFSHFSKVSTLSKKTDALKIDFWVCVISAILEVYPCKTTWYHLPWSTECNTDWQLVTVCIISDILVLDRQAISLLLSLVLAWKGYMIYLESQIVNSGQTTVKADSFKFGQPVKREQNLLSYSL